MNKTLYPTALLLIVLIVPQFILAQSTEETNKMKSKIYELEQRIIKLEKAIGGAPSPSITYSTKWKNLTNWRKLQRGMSFNQVRQLLGEPTEIKGGFFTYWYYRDSSKFGQVEFSNDILSGWREP